MPPPAGPYRPSPEGMPRDPFRPRPLPRLPPLARPGGAASERGPVARCIRPRGRPPRKCAVSRPGAMPWDRRVYSVGRRGGATWGGARDRDNRIDLFGDSDRRAAAPRGPRAGGALGEVAMNERPGGQSRIGRCSVLDDPRDRAAGLRPLHPVRAWAAAGDGRFSDRSASRRSTPWVARPQSPGASSSARKTTRWPWGATEGRWPPRPADPGPCPPSGSSERTKPKGIAADPSTGADRNPVRNRAPLRPGRTPGPKCGLSKSSPAFKVPGSRGTPLGHPGRPPLADRTPIGH